MSKKLPLIVIVSFKLDVAKSELEIYKSKHEGVLNQLKEAKDNLERSLETREQRKRYPKHRSGNSYIIYCNMLEIHSGEKLTPFSSKITGNWGWGGARICKDGQESNFLC